MAILSGQVLKKLELNACLAWFCFFREGVLSRVSSGFLAVFKGFSTGCLAFSMGFLWGLPGFAFCVMFEYFWPY